MEGTKLVQVLEKRRKNWIGHVLKGRARLGGCGGKNRGKEAER